MGNATREQTVSDFSEFWSPRERNPRCVSCVPDLTSRKAPDASLEHLPALNPNRG